jgi:cell division protein FtsA
MENLRQCVASSGVEISQFVLNPLASGEVVLNETERQMGAVVCDIGGGTTDIAIYIDGDVWHTSVLAVGGNHITSDIAHGLRLPVSQAEEIKLQHGHALRRRLAQMNILQSIPLEKKNQPRSTVKSSPLSWRVKKSSAWCKKSNALGMMVLPAHGPTGGSAHAGIRTLASKVLGIPVRIASPKTWLVRRILSRQLFQLPVGTALGSAYGRSYYQQPEAQACPISSAVRKKIEKQGSGIHSRTF